MKSWTLKIAMMLMAVLALTACPDGKKGGAAPAPGAAGLCVPGPTGPCMNGVAFSGSGQWGQGGYLTVNPAHAPAYRQFLIENNLCRDYGCNRVTQWVGVSMNVRGNRGRFVITPYELNGWSRRSLMKRALSFAQNGGAGFQLVERDDNYYIAGPRPQVYPQPIQAPATIQLSNIFTNAYGNEVTTTLYYRGLPIASGRLQGQRNMYNGY